MKMPWINRAWWNPVRSPHQGLHPTLQAHRFARVGVAGIAEKEGEQELKGNLPHGYFVTLYSENYRK